MRHCASGGTPPARVTFAPLKGVSRSLQKAQYDYGERNLPISWISDVVRGTVVCESPAEAARFYETLATHKGVEVVKMTNRFTRPTPAGFRDLNVKFRLDPGEAAGTVLGGALPATAVAHICEVQVHLKALDELALSRNSHVFYEFFRHFFRGDWSEVEDQSSALRDIFEAGASSLQGAVDSVLNDPDANASLLNSLALLTSDQLGRERGVRTNERTNERTRVPSRPVPSLGRGVTPWHASRA